MIIKNGPHAGDVALSETQKRVTKVSGWIRLDYTFPDPRDDNLFARLIHGENSIIACLRYFNHVAFFTPFPNALSFTVVILRRHLSSDILSLDEHHLSCSLVDSTWEVSKFLKSCSQCEVCRHVLRRFRN